MKIFSINKIENKGIAGPVAYRNRIDRFINDRGYYFNGVTIIFLREQNNQDYKIAPC